MARRSRARVTGEDSPKTKKAEARRARAEHLTSDDFFDFVDRANAHQAEITEAGSEHATLFKETDKLGIHRQAVKLFLRLDRKEEAQRNDLLRAFDRYRDWATETGRWNPVADMVDAAERASSAAAREAATTSADTDASRAPAREESAGTGNARPPTEAKADAPEADWAPGDDRPQEEINKDLDAAGYTFADGRAAGQRGEGAEKNPHRKNSAPFKVWERGRLQGASEGEVAGGADDHANGNGQSLDDVQPPKRKRATAAGPVAVH